MKFDRKQNLKIFLGAAIAASALIAIALVMNNKSALVVKMTETALLVNDSPVTGVVINSKDGYPDFPDSSYDALSISPLRNAIITYSKDSTKYLLIRIPALIPYASWKPILITVQNSGFDSAIIRCGDNDEATLYFEKGNRDIGQASDAPPIRNKYIDPTIYLNRDSIIVRADASSYLNFCFCENPDSNIYEDTLFSGTGSDNRLYSQQNNHSRYEITKAILAIWDSSMRNHDINVIVDPITTCKELIALIGEFENSDTLKELSVGRLMANETFLHYKTKSASQIHSDSKQPKAIKRN